MNTLVFRTNRILMCLVCGLAVIVCSRTAWTQPAATPSETTIGVDETRYTIGVNDILEISVLEPDELSRVVNVSPDGTIMFPFIGQVYVDGRTVPEVQDEIRDRLNDGYLKYPVVLVALQESRSRQYLVYGEVVRPGSYPITDNTTVLRAISVAGGFSKFGSSSRVKVLRSRGDQPGYETLKIDIKAVMSGNSDADILLEPGDMVVVSEGVF